jgi:hypothetical protein
MARQLCYTHANEVDTMIEIEKLPTSGQVAIDIHVSATVNVSAFSAKQKVTRFVASQISTHMHGGEPKMVVGDRIVWRVPVIFSMAPQGERGVELTQIPLIKRHGRMNGLEKTQRKAC